MIAAAATDSGPKRATIGTRTTVMAPEGPETCRLDPSSAVATNPATTAVTRPPAALTPEVAPKPRASGRATIVTVTPAGASLRQPVRSPA